MACFAMYLIEKLHRFLASENCYSCLEMINRICYESKMHHFTYIVS